MKKDWTTKEVKYLIDNYQGMSTAEIATNLGRTYGSVNAQKGKLRLRRDYKKVEYALYKGDTLLHTGTLDELAKKHGVKVETIRFYTTPAHRRRSVDLDKAILVHRVDDT